jgi:predicted AlkP superfamily phosphohydrolase/phosphomutase
MRSKLLALSLLAGLTLALPAAAREAKTVILGFDGADAKLAEQWMNEGKLPNLAKLRAEGTFAPLRSTIPSQTPVAWSTFATGLNPGRHGVFDFLKRNPDTYRPDLALVTETRKPFLWGASTPAVLGLGSALILALIVFGLLKLFRLRTRWAVVAGAVLGVLIGAGTGVAAHRWLPLERPEALNPRRGETFWESLGRHGERVRVIRLPQNFPPKAWEHGELFTGLGTPDLSLRIGKPFYFTSELFFQPRGGNDVSAEVVELVDNKGRIETEIKEVPDELFSKKGERYLSTPMVLNVPQDRSHLEIEVGGEKLDLKVGDWSDWVTFTFAYNPLLKLHGIGRFRLIALTPEIKLYLSPIQFDPKNLPPILNVTTPRNFAEHLTDRFGRFKTIGWAIDTWSLKGGTIDEGVFLEDVRLTREKEEQMLYGFLDEGDQWDVLVQYFEYTDRVQHMMWRLFDREHPMYDAALAAKYGGSILASYQDMDRIVGETVRRVPKGTHVMVVSDHGFAPFRWEVNYNTWLAQNGYMTLVGTDSHTMNLEDLFDQGEFFTNVDWSKTKAYALGLGNIYINLRGREAKGIVNPGAEYEALRQEIKSKLEAFVDPNTGQHPVAHVFTREEAHHGVFDPAIMPDLIPSNGYGYRVGWQDTLGGIAKVFIQPNTDVWSGDHCSVYPPLVNGILFSNRKLVTTPRQPYIGDIFPTVVASYGVKPPAGLDGQSLLPPS